MAIRLPLKMWPPPLSPSRNPSSTLPLPPLRTHTRGYANSHTLTGSGWFPALVRQHEICPSPPGEGGRGHPTTPLPPRLHPSSSSSSSFSFSLSSILHRSALLRGPREPFVQIDGLQRGCKPGYAECSRPWLHTEGSTKVQPVVFVELKTNILSWRRTEHFLKQRQEFCLCVSRFERLKV